MGETLLLVKSPVGEPGFQLALRLCTSLNSGGIAARLCLVQDAVAWAVAGMRNEDDLSQGLDGLRMQGYALREDLALRGFSEKSLRAGFEPISVARLAECLVDSSLHCRGVF